jgi:hypothetical protein
MSTIGALQVKAATRDIGLTPKPPSKPLPKPKLPKRKTPHIWSAERYREGQEQK